MKIKIAKATNTKLDWMVAEALGYGPKYDMLSHGLKWPGWWLSTRGEYARMPKFSTDWSEAGPIIERECINSYHYELDDVGKANPGWCAHVFGYDSEQTGPTPLIAAMRCFVASKLGDEVEIPEDLK